MSSAVRRFWRLCLHVWCLPQQASLRLQAAADPFPAFPRRASVQIRTTGLVALPNGRIFFQHVIAGSLFTALALVLFNKSA